MIPAVASARSEHRLPARIVALARNLPRRTRERSFWVIQAAVIGITVAHLAGEIWADRALQLVPVAIHHIPVVLYLGPISYASLRYGTEGAVLTGLWSAILTVPNILVWHRTGYEWLTELFFIAMVILAGALVAVPVERERRATRRLQDVERQRLLSYAHLVTEAQEDERKRMARELHDEAAQSIVVIQRDLASLAETLPNGSVASELCRLRDLAGQTLVGIRRFSRDLRPPTLDELGLPPALEQLLGEFGEREGAQVELHVNGSVRRAPIDIELAVFRIVQAALHNVERHAGATHVVVELTFEDGSIRLTVADDGRGFVPPEHFGDLAQLGKLGLLGMFERAELIGGTLTIDSAPGEGTRIHLTIDHVSGKKVRPT